MSSSNRISYGPKEMMTELELDFDKEFDFDGRSATWARDPEGPRFWDKEDEYIDLPSDDPVTGIVSQTAMALTADDNYLAIAINAMIRIYDVDTLQLCSEIPGLEFNVQKVVFLRHRLLTSEEGRSAYILISETNPARNDDPKIHLHAIDPSGQPTTPSLPNPISGRLPSFASSIVSLTTPKFLYIANPHSTQQHARPADQLPQLVVFNVSTQSEVCRLLGHIDAIMWVSWSPDESTIVTASWDRTYRIWNALTGECNHIIGPTNGQNWTGGFGFGDGGKHVLLSGGGPTRVGIWDVESGRLKVGFETPVFEGRGKWDWWRCNAVHPTKDLVILQNGRKLFAWNHCLSGPQTSTVQTFFALKPAEDFLENRRGGIQTLKWVDEGRKLIAQGEEHTTYVWDIERHVKWRFQRPRGRAINDVSGPDVLYLRRKGSEWVVSVGEGKARFWRL